MLRSKISSDETIIVEKQEGIVRRDVGGSANGFALVGRKEQSGLRAFAPQKLARKADPQFRRHCHKVTIECSVEGRREAESVSRIVAVWNVRLPRRDVARVEQAGVGNPSDAAGVLIVRHHGPTEERLPDSLF